MNNNIIGQAFDINNIGTIYAVIFLIRFNIEVYAIITCFLLR